MIEQCADKGMELYPYIEEMVRAAQDLEKAKRKRDRDASRRAEKEIQQAAHKVIKIEPTVVHLYMKACHPVLESYIREAWISNMPKMDNSLASVFFSSLFTPPDLASLPAYSFALQFTFRLRKPYLSRDDTDWHILDNPVRKEKVFGLPMVAPAGWKGALRAAMTRELASDLNEDEQENESDSVKKRLRLYRLFGNEDASAAAFLNRALAQHWVGSLPEDADDEQREEWQKRIEAETKRAAQEFDALLREQGYRRGNVEGFQGRLRFYPTFFTQTDLEVINPHPRASGAGKQPIYFECVPIGAQGTFTLLYVPFDLFGEPEEKARAELADDLMTAGEGIRAMLTVYGFGAKTSSGFGLSDQQVTDGNLTIRTEAEPLPFPFDSLPGLSVLADAAAKQLRPGGAQ